MFWTTLTTAHSAPTAHRPFHTLLTDEWCRYCKLTHRKWNQSVLTCQMLVSACACRNWLCFLLVRQFSEYFIINYVDASHYRCSYFIFIHTSWILITIFYLNNESRMVIITLSTATSLLERKCLTIPCADSGFRKVCVNSFRRIKIINCEINL